MPRGGVGGRDTAVWFAIGMNWHPVSIIRLNKPVPGKIKIGCQPTLLADRVKPAATDTALASKIAKHGLGRLGGQAW